jgi:hypothetical protein
MRRGWTPLALLAALVPGAVLAQNTIRLPEQSPAAFAGQTIGVTDIEIRYHRPAMNKRKIFGGLVPYGVLWRAGANENTTISVSTPVKVEGKALPAGTYALYMLPAAGEWTVVFSRFADDWGTFNYDPSEDVLRVKVTPKPISEIQERLLYTFDDLTDSATVASLRWEKIAVPIRIEVDVPATVRASIQAELRGGKHWNANAWAEAAIWELRHGDPKIALEYADHALATGSSLRTLRVKAAVLEKNGDAKGAAALRAKARSIANDAETILITVGELTGQKKNDEAIAYLNDYIARHPDSHELWRAYAQLGDLYNERKDRAKAEAAWGKAMNAAHDIAEKTEVQDSLNAAGAEGP